MKKLLLLFSFLASFMLGLTSCTDEPETTTGIISGTVTLGPDGIAPLEGVTVTLAELGHSKTTDQYGLFSFENVTPGVYTLKFYKAGYSTESRGVTVMRDDVSVCDLSMQPEETSESLTLSDFRLSFSKDITEKTFTIYNDGNSGTINWEISGITVDWLTVTPPSGATAQGRSSVVKVIVDHDKISGNYAHTTIYVDSNGFSIPLEIEASNLSNGGNGGNDDNNGGNGGNGGAEDYSSAQISCDLPDLDIQLISCRRKSGNIVELVYTMTNTDGLHPQSVTINNVNAFTGHTHIADNLGNQYPKDQVKISLAGKDFGYGNNIEGTLLDGIPAKVVVTVKAVDPDATLMTYYLYTSTAKAGGVNYTSDVILKNVRIY